MMSPWHAWPEPSQVLVELAMASMPASLVDPPVAPPETGAGEEAAGAEEEATGAGEDDTATGAGAGVVVEVATGCREVVVATVVDTVGATGAGATGVGVLVTVGAALGVVGTATKFPPGTSVDTGCPSELTHRVTGTSTVVQAVSVTRSGDGARTTSGRALTIAARAARTMVLVIGAIVSALMFVSLWCCKRWG